MANLAWRNTAKSKQYPDCYALHIFAGFIFIFTSRSFKSRSTFRTLIVSGGVGWRTLSLSPDINMSAPEPSRGPSCSHRRGHAPPPRIGSNPKPGLPRRWEPLPLGSYKTWRKPAPALLSRGTGFSDWRRAVAGLSRGLGPSVCGSGRKPKC